MEKILYIRTDFKGGKYISPMVGGFNAYCFIGTLEEYNKACETFYKNEDNGKIIGRHTFNSLEEYNNHFNIIPVKELSAEDLEFNAKWEAKWEAEYERKLKRRKYIENR
jgi:hypothetical protein